jgi:hypothetical protein
MAKGMVRIVKRFFAWLAEPVRQDETSAADGVMLKLQAPPRTRMEIGEKGLDPDDERGDAPAEIEIGRASAVAKIGCLPERISLASSQVSPPSKRPHKARSRSFALAIRVLRTSSIWFLNRT